MRGNVFLFFDDVSNAFFEIGRDRLRSIFDQHFFQLLQYWHRLYGACFSLYCFVYHRGFSLEQFPDTYRDEFEANVNWLRFGFHGYSELYGYNSPTMENVAQRDYQYGRNMLCRVVGERSVIDTVRIHNRAASGQAIKGMKAAGLRGLICRSGKYDLPCYDLTRAEQKYIQQKRYIRKQAFYIFRQIYEWRIRRVK